MTRRAKAAAGGNSKRLHKMLTAQIAAVETLEPGADHVTAERAAKMIAALAKTAETLTDLRVQEDKVNHNDDPNGLPSDLIALDHMRADLERRLARLAASLEQKRDLGAIESGGPKTD